MWQEPNCELDLDVYKDWLYEFNNNDDLRDIDFCATLPLGVLEHFNYHRKTSFESIGDQNYKPPNCFSIPYIMRHHKVGSGPFYEDPFIGERWFGDDGNYFDNIYYGCGI